jgi:hypothetical protein
MVFATRLDDEDQVKIWGHYYIYLSVVPKNWLFCTLCTQQGRLMWKSFFDDGYYYIYRQSGFGGLKPLHLVAPSEVSAPTDLSTVIQQIAY